METGGVEWVSGPRDKWGGGGVGNPHWRFYDPSCVSCE